MNGSTDKFEKKVIYVAEILNYTEVLCNQLLCIKKKKLKNYTKSSIQHLHSKRLL